MPNTSRTRTLWTSVLSFALVAALSACAMDEQIADDETAADLTFEAISPVNADNVETINVDARISGYGDYFDGTTVCSCQTEECVAEFINKNFGCEICVSFQCEGGGIHACNPCNEGVGEPLSSDHVGPAERR